MAKELFQETIYHLQYYHFLKNLFPLYKSAHLYDEYIGYVHWFKRDKYRHFFHKTLHSPTTLFPEPGSYKIVYFREIWEKIKRGDKLVVIDIYLGSQRKEQPGHAVVAFVYKDMHKFEWKVIISDPNFGNNGTNVALNHFLKFEVDLRRNFVDIFESLNERVDVKYFSAYPVNCIRCLPISTTGECKGICFLQYAISIMLLCVVCPGDEGCGDRGGDWEDLNGFLEDDEFQVEFFEGCNGPENLLRRLFFILKKIKENNMLDKVYEEAVGVLHRLPIPKTLQLSTLDEFDLAVLRMNRPDAPDEGPRKRLKTSQKRRRRKSRKTRKSRKRLKTRSRRNKKHHRSFSA